MYNYLTLQKVLFKGHICFFLFFKITAMSLTELSGSLNVNSKQPPGAIVLH